MDEHFYYRGQEWIGYLMARKFLDEIEPQAGAGLKTK
jgi:hypothetical protein